MPNYYLSVLYKHIIQVENKNVGLKVGGHKHTIAPPVKKVGEAHAPLAPPLPTPVLFPRLSDNVLFLQHCSYMLDPGVVNYINDDTHATLT